MKYELFMGDEWVHMFVDIDENKLRGRAYDPYDLYFKSLAGSLPEDYLEWLPER